MQIQSLMEELKRVIERLANFLDTGLVQAVLIPYAIRRRRHQTKESRVIPDLLLLGG